MAGFNRKIWENKEMPEPSGTFSRGRFDSDLVSRLENGSSFGDNVSPIGLPKMGAANHATAYSLDSLDDSHGGWSTGVEQIDACLPSGQINPHGLHEVEPLRPTQMPSLTGFTFGLLARLGSSRPIIWCVTSEQVGEYGHLYAHGLQRYGISPAQVIFSKVNRPEHLHFALEEAIKTDGVAAVIGEGPKPSFTGSRRLSLLTREHKRPCMLLNPECGNNKNGGGSAALTRWQIAPSQGVEDPHDPFGPGLPTWRVALTRSRGGRSMQGMDHSKQDETTSQSWRIVWDDQTFSFHSTSLFRNGTVRATGSTRHAADETVVGRRRASTG